MALPTFARAIDRVVGVADIKASNTPGERLITYALDSCLGLVVDDPMATVAGMLLVMFPTGTIDEAKMRENPAMFVDSGVPLLFNECQQLGARKECMRVKVAGGAYAGAREEDDRCQIVRRNLLALHQLLSKNSVLVHAHDTGGVQTTRTIWVEVTSGEVTLRINGTERSCEHFVTTTLTPGAPQPDSPLLGSPLRKPG